MTAVRPADADAFVRRPDPAQPVVLVFGPDAGLVSERAEALVGASVDDPADPFAIVKLSGDELAADPAKLADEAFAIPMFGGRRAIRVRAGSRNFLPAVEALLAAPAPECRVIIEAGDLKRSAPLRALIEKARNAAAIACYADERRDLERLIAEELSGLAVAPEAQAALLGLLGGDRMASRGELRKLALFAHGEEEVTLDHVMAVVGDASAASLDQAVDACFAGEPAALDTHYGKAREAGTAPAAIVAAAQRQCAALHRLALDVAAGARPGDAVGARVHFRRKPAWERALARWSPERLAAAMDDLARAALRIRQNPALADSLAHRVLAQLALTAARR